MVQEINQCPFLEDLDEYLNWRVEYSGVFGPSLKNYLISNPLESTLEVLETQPGRILKLPSNADIEQLKSFIESGDAVAASGVLVSLLVIKYRSLVAAPQALIVNEMLSSLSVLIKRASDSDPVEERLNAIYDKYLRRTDSDDFISDQFGGKLSHGLMGFVGRFIEKMPIKIAAKIIFAFVLDPIVHLTSNHDFKKQVFGRK